MAATDNRTTEQDHSKVREMIISYVKNTGNKVMVCAEMTYQVEMGKEVLVDPLPAEIKKNVVWRDTYWLPDEAASIYSKAQAVISLECHSPLIALHNGTPTFYVRQPTDTCKGQMYRDFGANEWFFEVDETNGPELWSRLPREVSLDGRDFNRLRGRAWRTHRADKQQCDRNPGGFHRVPWTPAGAVRQFTTRTRQRLWSVAS